MTKTFKLLNFVTLKELQEKSAFLKAAAQILGAFGAFLKVLGFLRLSFL